MKVIATGAAMVLAAFLTCAAEEQWGTDFDAAKKAAKEKNVPILADFSGSDWCGWCIRLDKEVFSQKDFQDYAKDNVVLFMADFPRRKKLPDELAKQNNALAGKYGVEGFPTVLILDAEGKELARTGYKPGGAKVYVDHLKGLIGTKRLSATEATSTAATEKPPAKP